VRDGVLLRLIGKWLNAGVLENGTVWYPEAGTPQGGVLTPPTMLPNARAEASHKRVGWYSEHDIHLLSVDFDAADQRANNPRPTNQVPALSHLCDRAGDNDTRIGGEDFTNAFVR
jgi:hypothetical protein